MSNSFSNHEHFAGLFPCICEFSRSSLVSMLRDREPGRKPPLTVEVLILRDGNSNILNQRSEAKRLCFLLLPKMVGENEK